MTLVASSWHPGASRAPPRGAARAARRVRTPRRSAPRAGCPGHSKAGAGQDPAGRPPSARRTAAARFRSRSRDRVLGAQPVLSYRGVADPTVARYAGGWVAVSTGPGAPRALAPQPGGPWQNIPSALTVQPSWAISGRYWASDLVQVNGLWLLYFSAEVAGLGLDGRCIGVATATDPTGAFVPDERPLVCPRQAAAPPAYDKIKRRDRNMPKGGVIDPDFFKDKRRHQYLLYRTQGTPSSIRLVELPGSGRPDGQGAQHRAGPPRRRDREPDDGAPRAAVRAAHLRGRVRRVQLQDHLPSLGEAHRLVEVEAAGAGRQPARAGCAAPAAPTSAAAPAASRCCSSTRGPAPSSAATARAATTTTASNLYDARRSLFAACCGSPAGSHRGSVPYVTPILPPPPPSARPDRRRPTPTPVARRTPLRP